MLVASWDAPAGGGISTQGQDLRDLQAQIMDRCLFTLKVQELRSASASADVIFLDNQH